MKFECNAELQQEVAKNSYGTVTPMMFKREVICSIFVSSDKVEPPHQASSTFCLFFLFEHPH